MAQDGEDMVPLDPELLAVLEEEAASRYTEEDNQFTEDGYKDDNDWREKTPSRLAPGMHWLEGNIGARL